MGIKRNLLKNAVQIWAISKLNLKKSLRFKLTFVMRFINPLLALIIPLFIMGFIFSGGIISSGVSIGVFGAENYISLILLGTCGTMVGGFWSIYDQQFREEKVYKTLPALIIAPFNRFNLLLGIFLSHLILILFPFSTIFILNLILSPNIPSIGSLLVILLTFFLYALTLSGLGLVLGVLAISRQNWRTIFSLGYRIIVMFNCVTFPKEIFPEILGKFIDLNPFFHFFELNRYIWVFDNIFYPGNGIHFLIIIICAIISPIIGIILFNQIYSKYGIEGV